MRRHNKQTERLLHWSVRRVALPMAQTSRIEARLRAILQPTRRQTMVTRKMVTVATLATVGIVGPLAVLRPVALAERPRPANPDAPASPGGDGPRSADGVRVELAGVTRIPQGGNNLWWGPTGKPLPTPLPRVHTPFSRGLIAVQHRALAFKVTAPGGKAVPVDFRSPHGCISSSSLGVWVGKTTGQTMEAQLDALGSGYRVMGIELPAEMAQVDVRLGVGVGPWRTAADNELALLGSAGTIDERNYDRYIFGPVIATKGGSAITITLSKFVHSDEAPENTEDLRVVAVDAAGHKHLPAGIDGNYLDSVEQIQTSFAMPPGAIKLVRVETRPFHWVTFHNVPLRPRS